MTNDERGEVRKASYTGRPLLDVYAHALQDLEAFRKVIESPDEGIEWWRLPDWLSQDLRDIETHREEVRSPDAEDDIRNFIVEFNEMHATMAQLIDRLKDYA